MEKAKNKNRRWQEIFDFTKYLAVAVLIKENYIRDHMGAGLNQRCISL